MSRNYDYPPASRRTTRANRASDRSQRPTGNRLQHLRDLLSSERHRNSSTTARALDILNQEIEEYRSSRARNWTSFDQARAAVDRQIQLLQAATSHREDQTLDAQLGFPRPGAQRPSALNATVVNPYAVRSATTQSASSSRSSRRRPRRPRTREGRNRNSGANSPLDEPIPRSESLSAMPLEPDTDPQGDRRRAKRRKLEADDKREGPQAFRYGHYGQVVPGPLKMEIKMCDGGTYDDDTDGENSCPDSILRNDSSVYCTKSDRCNLVIKHRGDAPFCLSKIVIKAPKIGYDAPIQEGMVFVSMEYDDILARTAALKVLKSTPRRSVRNRRNGIQSSEEYLNALRAPLQTLERAVFGSTDPPSDSDSDISTIAGPDAPNPMAEFQVTTEYDGTSDGDDGDDMDSEDDLGDEFERSESEDSGTERVIADEATFYRRRGEMLQRIEAMEWSYQMERRGQRRRRVPPRAETVAPPAPSVPSAPSALSVPSTPSDSQSTDPSSPAVLKPHARFFIERAKSMVSIKFDPPASGRYILVKLWNPRNDGNIDIQSIIAYGYAGPRFFPSADFR